MKKHIKIIFFTMLSFCWLGVQAQVVSGLSVGTVLVKDRSQAALTQAAPQALQQVLIKVSGDPSVNSIPIVSQTMPDAATYVQSFSYGMNQQNQLIAQIQFDDQAVARLLSQAQVAVWSDDRPLTLAWLQVDDQKDTNPSAVLSSGDQSPVSTALQSDANRFGLPLIFPAMDLQDQNFVNQKAALPFDSDKLSLAGKRYDADSVLAGHLSQAIDGSWQGQWFYILDGQAHQWNTVGATAQAVVDQSLSNVDSIMSSTYAARDNAALQSQVSMQISGVTSLDDYALVMNDLKQLSAVAHIDVAQLQGSVMQVRVAVIGGKSALTAALASSADLSPASGVLSQGARPADAYYHFNNSHSNGDNS